MRKALILVADGNPEYREWLAFVLARYGFETISAKSGREAVELAIKCRPDLVFMDLNMPDLDGYEATRAMHADRHSRGIPVVAVPAECTEYGFDRWAFKAGFIALLAKPWNPGAVLEVVTNVLMMKARRAA